MCRSFFTKNTINLKKKNIYLFFCIKGGSLHFEIDDKCAEIHLNMIESIVNEKYFSEINDKKAILCKKKIFI